MSDYRLRAFVLVGALAVAVSAFAQDELSKGDKRWMEEEVGAIITAQETATFQSINKDDRKLFKELFWARRDFNPTTSKNEFKDGYEDRVKAADDQFKMRGRNGSLTDMGQLFILLGGPDSTEHGRGASMDMPGAGTPGGPGEPHGEEPGARPEPDEGGGLGPDLRGGGAQMLTWVYNPRPELGLPDGLMATFRNQQNFGYRLINRDDIAESLDRVKQRLVQNPAVNYALDENGRLRKLDDRYDPNSPAKKILNALLETGETSSAIEFTVNPMFFRSTAGQIYIPMDFVLASELSSNDVTVFGTVENADGFPIYQFEEPAEFVKGKRGHLAYEMPIQLQPGLYTLYVGVLDGEQVHGTQIMDLEVPDYETGDLTLSSVLLFSEGNKTGEAMGAPGKAFMLGGYHFIPKKELVYTKADQISGVFNAYNYGVEGGNPNLLVQCVFSKDGVKKAQTKNDSFMLQTAEMALTIFDVPLNIPNFSEAGEYTLEITVTDEVNKKTLKKEISFVIQE
jgi:GWxTD domain-containing protein